MSAHHHHHIENRQTLKISLALVASFMLVEVIGGIATNSLALLADAGHMFSDAISLGLSFFAFTLSSKEPDKKRTFGYQRFEILAAAINATTLIVISLIILFEALRRLFIPEPVLSGGMLVIAMIGLLINLFQAWYMHHHGDTHGNLNLKSAYLHVLSDMFGSLAAIIAALLIMAFNWRWADPIASLIVSLLILRSGWQIMKSVFQVLMEGTPEALSLSKIAKKIQQIKGVMHVHDLHIWTLTSHHYILSCHVVVADDMPINTATQLIAQIENTLLDDDITHVTVQIEGQHSNHHSTDSICTYSHS